MGVSENAQMNRQSKLAKGQYPETDWQTFKQLLNIWFDFAEYRDDLPFQCSRSKLALNIAGLIREKKARIEDLAVFSKDLQWDVRCLLGNESILEEWYGIRRGEEDERF